MKQFLSKISLFIVFGLILLIGIERFLSTVSNEYSYKRKYVEEQGDKIKVLVLGHSHTGNAIIPECMGDSVFNMAITGRRCAFYDAEIAKRYVPKLKNLECVIWPLGYNFQYVSALYPCLPKENGLDGYQLSYAKYMDISYERYIPNWHFSEVLQSKTRFFSRPFKHDFIELNGCTPTGHEIGKRTVSEIDWGKRGNYIEVDYESSNAPLAKEEGMREMKRMAEVCYQSKKRLVVISTPCYKTFQEWMTERGKREMQECVEAMRSAYPEMEYYNYIADPRFTEEDFKNADHLSDEGAEKFSKILKDTLGL